MKKIFSLLVILVAFGASVFAVNQNKYNVFYQLNNTTTFNSLVSYLDVDNDQANDLKSMFSITENKLKSASEINSDSYSERAMFYNLVNAKSILSEDQYRKYLIMINESTYNDNVTLLALNDK